MSLQPVHLCHLLSFYHLITSRGWFCGDSLGCDEGMLFDGGQDITKLDFCCEGVSVVDDWHSIGTIPAVH